MSVTSWLRWPHRSDVHPCTDDVARVGAPWVVWSSCATEFVSSHGESAFIISFIAWGLVNAFIRRCFQGRRLPGGRGRRRGWLRVTLTHDSGGAPMVRHGLCVSSCWAWLPSAPRTLNRTRNRAGSRSVVPCSRRCLPFPTTSRRTCSRRRECVIVIPSAMKACLGDWRQLRPWCDGLPPGKAFTASGRARDYTLEGGSVGFQIGGEATDLVLLVMNSRGVNALLKSKVKLGANASVAAGPRDVPSKPPPTRRCAQRSSALQVAWPVRRRVAFRQPRCVPTMTPTRGLRREVHRAPHRDGRGDERTGVGQRLVDALREHSPRNESNKTSQQYPGVGRCRKPGTPVNDRAWAPAWGRGSSPPCGRSAATYRG